MILFLTVLYGFTALAIIGIGSYLIHWLDKRDKTRQLHIQTWKRLRTQYLKEIQSEWNKNT